MAKCKLCKAEIPDGKEYCNNCQDKGKLKANESYLDSLLNSVKNNVPASETIYKKKNDSDGNSLEASREKSKVQEKHEETFYQLDPEDIEDFDQFYKDENLQDIPGNITIPEEDLFGEKLSDLFDDIDKRTRNQVSVSNTQLKAEQSKPKQRKEPSDLENRTTVQEDNAYRGNYQQSVETPLSSDEDITSSEWNSGFVSTEADTVAETEAGIDEKPTADTKVRTDDRIDEKPIADTKVRTDDRTDGITNADTVARTDDRTDEKPNTDTVVSTDEQPNAADYDDEDVDSDINDLLKSLDLLDENNESEPAAVNNQAAKQDTNKPGTEPKAAGKPEEEFEQIEPEEDDFLNLLNQISSDDPVADDVKAINDLLSGKPVADKDKSGAPSDVGEVFSDALKAVSSLNDPTEEELAVLDRIPDTKGKKDKKADKEKKAGKGKKEKGSGKKDKTEKALKEEQSKPKKGLFQRLFGNVEDENAKNKQQAQKGKAVGGAAAASKDTGKKKKAPKGKKGASSPTQDEDELLPGAKGKGRPSEDPALDKADNKKDKKEKKEKKKKTKEIIQVIDEIEEDEGRINRLGASIVFVFFGLLALLLLVGTNVISYTLSIQHATNYFDNQKYNQAYKEVYGEEIQAKDIELYEKIMTVMFVNKQLNSYNNYYSLGKYPEALDALLKGLKRYDKYIELATMLGIDSDLDYVRTQILAELKNVFKLTEAEALKINSNSDMKEYSLDVYNIVREKMND